MKKITTFLMLLISISLFSQDKIYVHTASTDNIIAEQPYFSVIDHPDLNNNPNAKVIVKQHWKGVYNDNPVGILYSTGRWIIANENAVDIPVNSSFNILIGDTGEFFTHIATTANQGSFGPSTTMLDNSLLNGQDPGPAIFISTNALGSGSVIQNPNQYGTYFEAADGTRQIYEEGESTPIPENAAFNVYIPNSGTTFHITSNDNNLPTAQQTTLIDHPDLNNNPEATFIFEHYWGVTGFPGTDVVLDKNLGLYYEVAENKWAIFTQDLSPMPNNVAFDILIVEQAILSTETNNIAINLAVSPNPTTDFVTLKSNSEIRDITIYNILGQIVIETRGVNTFDTQIDLSQQTTGTYIANVITQTGTQSIKLIKQ